MIVSTEDRLALESIVTSLERAWNNADAAQFAAPFAEDAEQINIFGMHLSGRRQIEERHAAIFTTIFEGSVNVLRIEALKQLTRDVILARVTSALDVVHGPMQGRLETAISMVLFRAGSRWEIALFHNTQKQRQAP